MISQRRTSPYSALSASSRLWMLPAGLPINPLLFLHDHHADELVIPWTRRGVARAARLVREADNFQAPHAGARALARACTHRTRPIAGRRRHGPAGRRRLEPFGDPAVCRMR